MYSGRGAESYSIGGTARGHHEEFVPQGRGYNYTYDNGLSRAANGYDNGHHEEFAPSGRGQNYSHDNGLSRAANGFNMQGDASHREELTTRSAALAQAARALADRR